ncbi:MAG: hypothetical protein JWP12_104 [Bacteroidetes bacterium]|nr:hypothetical protein [Bacteroidota bacterium]
MYIHLFIFNIYNTVGILPQSSRRRRRERKAVGLLNHKSKQKKI